MFIRSCIVLVLCIGRLVAQEESEIDGTIWKDMQSESKLAYVLGFQNGAVVGCSHSNDRECMGKLSKSFSLRSTTSDIKRSLEQFYGDEANVKIPIRFALLFVSQKMAGANVERLNRVLSDLRKDWN